MANITITGKSALDVAQRTEALKYLQDNASTEELMKLKKLAADPMIRGMLKNI